MARKKGNSAQEAALDKLLSALGTVRKFEGVRGKFKTVISKTSLYVKLDLPTFPIVRIGGRGGFEMPDISTYPGTAPPDNLEPPLSGRTAFDACLWGDKHVMRQGGGDANNSPLNSLSWESD